MQWNGLKPRGYSVYMIGRLMGIVFLGFLLQVLLDSVLPTLHDYYKSQSGGPYDAGLILPTVVITAYIIWIFPVAFYSFNLPKSKLFQGILFTPVVMTPLVWYDYYAPTSGFYNLHGVIGVSETIHLFRYTFFSVPFMFMLHLFLPDAKLFHEP